MMSKFTDEAYDSDISNLCDTTEEIHIGRKPKTHRPKTSSSRKRDRKSRARGYDHDPPYVSPPASVIIPSCTSHWNTTHLDSVGIFYDEFPKPIESLIDMVYNETGMFHPLTDKQRDLVNRIKDRMTFSCTLSDVQEFALVSSDFPSFHADPNIYEDILNHVEEEDLWNDDTSHERVQDFVTHLVMIIQWMMTNKTLPEAVFEDMFKKFINMCGLISSDGKVWKSEKAILGKSCRRVKSEADIAITTRQHAEAASIGRNLLTLVSIVKVKNLTHIQKDSPEKLVKKRPPARKASGSESSESERGVHKEPLIFHQIGTDVLGQHGGELLIHTDKYGGNLSKNNYFYRPGVIVVGTKVTFTLLVCSVKYWVEIRTRNTVEREKAVIYYSDQKDLLKKSDRDLLLESFARLKNSCL